MGENGTNLFILIPMIVLLLGVNLFFKMRKERKTLLGMVVVLLSAVRHNQKLVENFSFHRRTGKFKTGNWEKNRSKLDFLPQELLATLSITFDMAEDSNDRIDTARKYKSDSYMAGISVDKLEAPLAKSRQELEEWLQANMQNPEYTPKRRGLFG